MLVVTLLTCLYTIHCFVLASHNVEDGVRLMNRMLATSSNYFKMNKLKVNISKTKALITSTKNEIK